MSSEPRHVVCVHCSSINRVPADKLELDPVCGRCGKELLDGRPVVLTDANFERVTSRTELPVLVDFWATWCGPCVAMAPQFEQAARQLKGQVLLAKIDSDQSPQTSARFAIRSIPTLVKLQGGRESARQSGSIPAAQIVAFARR
jgi:thioredoxin 2